MDKVVIENNLKLAAQAISSAEGILIGAGAGMGVDSGLPDFRGNKGFWKAYPMFKGSKQSFADLANPMWFELAPRKAWGFYGHRFNLYPETKPHKGYDILKSWCDAKPLDGFVFTSNVDGQFQKAGFSENRIFECHGSIFHFQCSEPCSDDLWPSYNAYIQVNEENLMATSTIPRCPHCGLVIRPNILMFNDHAWIEDRAAEQEELYEKWIATNKNIVAIEIGAGVAIPSVRSACESLDCFLIRINPRDYNLIGNGVSLPMGALKALTKIDSLLQH